MAQFVRNNTNYHGARSKTSASTNETRDAKSKKGKKKNYSGSDNSVSWDSRSNSSSQYGNNRYSRHSNMDSWDDNPSESSWANGWETNSRKPKDDNSWANSLNSKKKNSATIWDNIEQDFPAIASSQTNPRPNVWEERRRKQEEIDSIVPSSEDEEQRMLKLALEMSKLDVVYEDKKRQRLEEEYQLQESLMRENLEILKLKYPEYLLTEDFVSDEHPSASDNNWSSEGYATAASNNYASTQSSHEDFNEVKRRNSHKVNQSNQNQITKNKKGNDNYWDDTKEIASNNTGYNNWGGTENVTSDNVGSENWGGTEDIVSNNTGYDTWGDSEPSQGDSYNLASKEKSKFQKIESLSNTDNGIKKSKEWNNDTYSDTSKCWDEPGIYDKSTNAFGQSEADDSSTQFKEKTYKSSNKSFNSTGIHTNKASNVKISKVVDMFGGWGSSSDYKKPQISKNYEENVKTLTNSSNTTELGKKSNKKERNQNDSQKSTVSSQFSSTVKKSTSLNVENFKSIDAAQLDDFDDSENFIDDTELIALSSLDEKCPLSRDTSQNDLPNYPTESTEISNIKHEFQTNSSKYILEDSSLFETSLSNGAIEKRKESDQDLYVSPIISTSNQILDNQGNRSPEPNFDDLYGGKNTNVNNSCATTYIASPKSVSTFSTADNIHLDSESRDSIQPPIPPQEYESAASCHLNSAEYIDPPFVPITRIDSPQPAFECINHPGSDNFAKTNCTESTLPNQDFKMPDISPEMSKFINPPNLLFDSGVNAPSQVSGVTSEVNQQIHQNSSLLNSGQSLPTIASSPSESLNIPSYPMNPMMGGMMNPMMVPGMNPMMMMPGMNTILWQQMVFLSNPFFARQLQAMEMHYRSMGLPTVQQNQFPQQMSSVPNSDAPFIKAENSFNSNIIHPPSEPNPSDSIINPPRYSTDVSQVARNTKSFEPHGNEPDFKLLKVSPESFEMEEAELLLNEFLPKKTSSVSNETPIPPPIQPPYYKDNVVPGKTTTSAQVFSDGLTASTVYAPSAAVSLPSSNLPESKLSNWGENFTSSSGMMLESRESSAKKNTQVPVTTTEIKSTGWGEIDKTSFSSNSNWDDDVDGWGLENYTTKSMGNPSNYDSRKRNTNRQPSSQPSFSRFRK